MTARVPRERKIVVGGHDGRPVTYTATELVGAERCAVHVRRGSRRAGMIRQQADGAGFEAWQALPEGMERRIPPGEDDGTPPTGPGAAVEAAVRRLAAACEWEAAAGEENRTAGDRRAQAEVEAFFGARKAGEKTGRRKETAEKEGAAGSGWKTGAVANRFLDLAEAGGTDVSGAVLQGLTYLAHGWHLATTGRPLADEPVLAAAAGPRFAAIEELTGNSEAKPVARRAGRSLTLTRRGSAAGSWRRWYRKEKPEDWTAEVNPGLSLPPAEDAHGRARDEILENVWKTYGDLTDEAMAERTAGPGTPWELARRGRQAGGDRTVVPETAVLLHLEEKLRRNRKIWNDRRQRERRGANGGNAEAGGAETGTGKAGEAGRETAARPAAEGVPPAAG